MVNFSNYASLFGLWVVQSLIALVWLLLIPSDSGTYSAARLLLIGSHLVTAIAFVVLALKFRSGDWSITSLRPQFFDFLYLIALALFIFSPIVIVILKELGQTLGIIYTAYAERLAPLMLLVSITGLEWCLWHIAAKRTDFSSFRPVLASTLKILLVFICVGMIVFFTKWGISPVRDGSFGNPPTPLLEWQIGLAVLAGTGVLLTESRWRAKRLDVVLFFLVYIVTGVIWLTDPLVPGFFATPPRAPNFEPYPFSDALIYAEYSQSALVGNGFRWPEVPTRPLYVMLLTWMHAIVGQNYNSVIALQTMLLAFFPAVLYLLGRELGSRPLGLMLALLAILRDLTSNHAAPFASSYSYSKLFFSELPTALFLVIFTTLSVKWIKSPKPFWFLLVVGGVLGVASLIRLQSAVLLVPLALITAIPLWKDRRLEWLRGLSAAVLGLLLVVSPWLARNYYAAGGLVLDNPISQSMVFARRWSGDHGNTIFPQLAGETTAQYVSRMNDIAINSFKRDPGRILQGVANHFFNNLISSLHTFPVRDRLASPAELLWPRHAFWQTGARSPLLSIFYLILLALGLAAAWTSQRWIGLLPFAFSLAYNAWTALFLSSGDRFLLPIDWTWHLYFALGLLTLSKAVLSGMHDFSHPPVYSEPQNAVAPQAFQWKGTAITAGLLLWVGLTLPLTELVFPKTYPALTQEQLSATLEIAPLEGELILYGRAIYPRYYKAGDGEPGSAKLGYGASDQARLVFYLVGPQPGLIIFPLESAPDFFPHASDVWIIGTLEDEEFHARIVKVKAGARNMIYGPDHE